jgi:hypothetical protein
MEIFCFIIPITGQADQILGRIIIIIIMVIVNYNSNSIISVLRWKYECKNEKMKCYVCQLYFSILPVFGIWDVPSNWHKSPSYQFWSISTTNSVYQLMGNPKLLTSQTFSMYGWKCPVEATKVVLNESNDIINVLWITNHVSYNVMYFRRENSVQHLCQLVCKHCIMTMFIENYLNKCMIVERKDNWTLCMFLH